MYLNLLVVGLLTSLLISNAISLRRDKSILFSRIVIKCLILSGVIAINNLYITPLEKGIGLYGGLFNVSVLTQAFNVFIFMVTAIILIVTGFFTRKVYVKNIHFSLYNIFWEKLSYDKNSISDKNKGLFRIIEYPLIIVFSIFGSIFLISSGDLISVFLCIELQSYGLYILSTLHRDSESSTASGLTYFLLGGLSSCFILLGSGLLYANSGTTYLDNIYMIYSVTEEMSFWYNSLLINLALVIFLVGFLFKISAAPFHFWSPDVYDGVPTVVTTFIAIVPKISILGLFIDLVSHMESIAYSWKVIFILSSLLSFVIGSVLGLVQHRIKRLFAYSTISHVGFILLGLCTDSMESIQACIFYILQYTISNLNAFLILLSIGFSLYLSVYDKGDSTKSIYNNLVDRNNSPIQLIAQMKGYFYTNSFLSISLAVTLFSFIGVPPIAGFFAKQTVLSAALDKGFIFLVIIAIITSVIGAVYYLNIVKQIFFYNNDYKADSFIVDAGLKGYVTDSDNNIFKSKKKQQNKTISLDYKNITISSGLTSSISVISLILLSFIFIPEEWFNIAGILVLTLYKI